MRPRMSAAEFDLFRTFLSSADRYLEFGSGGSTYVASGIVKSSVVSVDSSAEWLDSVRAKCVADGLSITPILVHVDIGPIGHWGAPTDNASREKWPSYHRRIWQDPARASADLYMVDGRFRVACFMQILLHCEADAVIVIHDFASRERYHVIHEVARQIAVIEDLSIFVPRTGHYRQRAAEILIGHSYEPL